jgi:MATE family multidrug resistance protein
MAQLVTLFLIMIFTYLKGYFYYYRLFYGLFSPNWEVCRSILTLGLPIGIQFGGELAAIAVVGYLMGFFGVNALAALQITNQYSIIGIMLSFSLAQALSLMISELYGRQEMEYFQVKRYLGAAVLLLAIYIIPVAFLFCVFSTEFAQLYSGTNHLDPEIKYLINHFFILSAFFLFLDGFRNLLSGALRGLHQSGVSSRINLGALWLISLPASWVTVFVFKGGPVALRASFLSGFVVAVILLAMQFYKMLGLIAPATIDEAPEIFSIEGFEK